MSNRFLIVSGIILTALVLSISAHADSAVDIMKKNEDVRKVKDVTSSATLITGLKGSERTKKFTWWRKLTSDGTHFNTFTRFHEPAEIKNEGILFLEHESDNADVFLYLPTFKKIRRVERSSQSGSFMGSEFSYADIATPHFDDYTFKFIKDEECAPKVTCSVIEATPKREETKERTGYSKTIQWVRKDNFMVQKAENFGIDGSLYKKITASDITEVDTKDHKWMSLTVKIENLKNSKYTELKFLNVKANQGIDDAIFTQNNLSKF